MQTCSLWVISELLIIWIDHSRFLLLSVLKHKLERITNFLTLDRNELYRSLLGTPSRLWHASLQLLCWRLENTLGLSTGVHLGHVALAPCRSHHVQEQGLHCCLSDSILETTPILTWSDAPPRTAVCIHSESLDVNIELKIHKKRKNDQHSSLTKISMPCEDFLPHMKSYDVIYYWCK